MTILQITATELEAKKRDEAAGKKDPSFSNIEQLKSTQFITAKDDFKSHWKGFSSTVIPREPKPVNKKEPALREFSRYWKQLRKPTIPLPKTVGVYIRKINRELGIYLNEFIRAPLNVTVQELKVEIIRMLLEAGFTLESLKGGITLCYEGECLEDQWTLVDAKVEEGSYMFVGVNSCFT